MRLETHGSKVYLATDTGILHVPGTLYLNESYSNHHTIHAVARALRVWLRLADAFDIDLAARALEGRWLTEGEKKALRYLVFRPIEDIESMSDRAVKTIASATKDREPNGRMGAVEPNTAVKQLVRIADFLLWFHKKVLEPRMSIWSQVTDALRQQVDVCAIELKKGVRGTKLLHPHRIRSVPTERFLQIYSAVYLQAAVLLRTANDKIGRNFLRDRAMILLACEGMWPGAIGNVALADFKWAGEKTHAYITIKDNTARRTKKLSTSTPVQKGVSSIQNYNSEITIAIWATTAQAIQDYIENERSAVSTRTLRNYSEGFLFLADHGGPIGDRGTIAHVFRRAGKGLTKMGLLSKDPADPYLDGEAYDFDAYLLRHSSASLFYATKSQTTNADVVTDLMEMRFGWSAESDMPALYAQRAMSNAASLTVDEYMESLLSEAKVSRNAGCKK
jgi:hypothetical protein